MLLLLTMQVSCGSLSEKNSVSLIFLVNSSRSCLICLRSLLGGVGANFRPFVKICFSVGVSALEERLMILMSIFLDVVGCVLISSVLCVCGTSQGLKNGLLRGAVVVGKLVRCKVLRV